jgi:putative ABC transport system permease protein
LLKNPAITGVAPSSEIPGKGVFAKNGVRRLGQDKAEFFPALVEIDKDFLETYQMSLVAGNNLPDREEPNIFESKQARVLLNEEAVAALGFKTNEAALMQTVVLTSWFGDIRGEIAGVVKNYHQRSVKENYDPIFYYHNNRSDWGYFSINMDMQNVAGNLAFIEKSYNEIFPGNAFDSFFLDEYFDRQYKADEQFGNIFSLFTILAIIIACLGLLGLSTFAIKLRTKEVGMRKILGSTTQNIVMLLSKDFIILVCLAALIATPVVYFVADNWLKNFAFHIELHWLIFVIAPLLLLIISLLTIGFQSIKAALSNPLDSLRND